ncbi:hypothetical protein RCL1_006286 [Eukaryota sp. TZLM3-RCL]
MKKLQWSVCNGLFSGNYHSLKNSLSVFLQKELETQSLPMAGSFLTVLPAGEKKINNLEFSQFLRWRLLSFDSIPIYSLCGFKDLTSSHFCACRSVSKMVINRHNVVKNCLASSLSIASDDVEKGFKDRRFIADFVLNNSFVDITVVGGHNHPIENALRDTATRKHLKYRILLEEQLVDDLIVLSFSIFGGFSALSMSFFKKKNPFFND